MIAANVLMIDDDSEALLSLVRALKAQGLGAEISAASTAVKALEIAKERSPQVCVVDLCLDEKIGPQSGFTLIRQLAADYPDARIIVLTGHGSIEHGVESLRAGAASFLEKPADIAHLIALIRDAITQSELRRELKRLQATRGSSLEQLLVGTSSLIVKVREAVLFAASNNQSVLLLGETGTGKGVCALAIHSQSARAHQPYVRYQPNFASADLVNSDLFGHVKGAFTGATEDRRGLVGEADRGTLFLDEIEELPVETQVTLLGVLQEKRYRAVGASKAVDSDFRLICASNSNVEDDIKAGKLRRDYYHRIAQILINLPTLRDRKEDLPLLAEKFLNTVRTREQLNVNAIGKPAMTALLAYNWPGNVRELEAKIESASYRAQFEGRTVIEPGDLGFESSNAQQGSSSSTLGEQDFTTQVESYKLQLIETALKHHNGNQALAAQGLKLDRSSMRRILQRHGKL